MGDCSDIFTPSPKQVPLLLDLLQSAACSLQDIAEELRITVAALTVYLASDEAIELLAQAELANARKGRLAATAQLDKCAHALSLILEGYIHDVTVAIRRDIPKTRRENLIHQESARRAATQLFKIANFTPRIFTARISTSTPPNRKTTHQHVATDACITPPTSAPFPPSTPANPTPANPTLPASPAHLLSPHPRRELPESHPEGGKAVRGPDGEAPEHQPASSNAQPNTLHDASHSPSPGGAKEGPVSESSESPHAHPNPATHPPPTLNCPEVPVLTSEISGIAARSPPPASSLPSASFRRGPRRLT